MNLSIEFSSFVLLLITVSATQVLLRVYVLFLTQQFTHSSSFVSSAKHSPQCSSQESCSNVKNHGLKHLLHLVGSSWHFLQWSMQGQHFCLPSFVTL